MKKQTPGIILLLVMITALASCFHFNDQDVSIEVSDDVDEYEMDADYNRSRTHAVQVYLNDHLLDGKVTLRRNSDMEREITLDDNTTFYINTHPGRLHISIDKTENSEQSYERVRQACEDLKVVITGN